MTLSTWAYSMTFETFDRVRCDATRVCLEVGRPGAALP